MSEHVNHEEHFIFEDRGRRSARCMLPRLEQHWLEIPTVWPGTREQAETIVHAFTTESLSQSERKHFVEVVQSGARVAWRPITAGKGESVAKLGVDSHHAASNPLARSTPT